MKIKVLLEVDLDKHIGKKYPGKQSSALGFSLLNTVFKAKMPFKVHKDVLEDFGVEVLEVTGLTKD